MYRTKIPVFLSLAVCLLGVFCQSQNQQPQWTSIFNGENLEGWTPKFTGSELGNNYKNTFRVKDGIMKVNYEAWEQFDGEFGHIFYKDKFSHYKIRVEYRFIGEQVANGPGWAFRNSGIMVHCQDPKTMTVDQSFPVCIEVQLLGGNGTDERPTANLCTPGTHVVINGQLEKTHCINSSSRTYHGDQWVTVEVEVRGSEVIRHWVDGQVVMEYTEPQLDETDADASKLIENGDKMVREGYISLQAETHPVEYRKVEILVLDD